MTLLAWASALLLSSSAPLVLGAADEEGFEVLFGGQSAEGWKQAGPGGFTIHDGMATAHGGMGLWYYEKRKFKNYILMVDFRQKFLSSNSGVFVRFPRVEGDPWIPVNEGYEIQIAGDTPGIHTTGSIYSFQAAREVPLKPAGEWNHYEIAVIGPMIDVLLNGRHVNSYKGDRSLQGGMIGIQNHDLENDGKSQVDVRNIRIKELPENAAGLDVLFDGRNLVGWAMAGPGEFVLGEQGTVSTRGGMGLLWHRKLFRDFILLLDWKVEKKSDNSGVFVRFPDPKGDPWNAVNQGYEIQIMDEADPKHRTGSVYSFKESSSVPTKDVGHWNHYEIQVVGQRYTIAINGQVVNEWTGERTLEGYVGLQNHDDGSRVTFRNVRAVSLLSQKSK
jgi:hypothetical protein